MNSLVTDLGLNPPGGGHQQTDALYFEFDGIMGDKNRGLLKVPGVQEQKRLKAAGISFSTEQLLFNGRQATAITVQEMSVVAKRLNIDPKHLGAEQLRANMMLNMIDGEEFDFSGVPDGSYIEFRGNGRPLLQVHWINYPCVVSGGYVAGSCGDDNIVSRFVKAAMDKRGLCLFVIRPGKLKLGDNGTVRSRVR